MTDLTAAFERFDLSADAVDSVLKLLADEGVDVIEAPHESEELAPRQIQNEARRAVTGDLVRIYLREIGRVPLLTAHDEVELAKAIEAGLFAEERLQTGVQAGCAGAELAELMLIAADGIAAKQRLMEANLRLVVSMAKWYIGRGLVFPRPDTGREPRPDAGGGEVRLHQGVQVFDVCDVVDPPGHQPGHRRPGQDNPDPGAHGGDINEIVRVQRSLLQEQGPRGHHRRGGQASEMSPDRVRGDPADQPGALCLWRQPLGEEDFDLSDVLEDATRCRRRATPPRSMLPKR